MSASSAPPDHALYEGTVRHRRRTPAYAFSQRVVMPLLDLDRLDEAWSVHPLVSDRWWAPVRYRRADHPGDPTVPLADAVRSLVQDRIGVRPEGRVRMLAHLRTLGWCFNPLTVYWCEDAAGTTMAQVLEVTNTPWHERHCYVLDTRGVSAHGDAGWTIDVAKALHVSPFLPMTLRHHVRSAPPGESLAITIDDRDDDGELAFSASLVARRRPFDRAGLTRLLTRHPLATHRVSAGIYWHALRLHLAGARFHPRPREGAAR